eukprot:2988896-Karenia_brevis.AAC.1
MGRTICPLQQEGDGRISKGEFAEVWLSRVWQAEQFKHYFRQQMGVATRNIESLRLGYEEAAV